MYVCIYVVFFKTFNCYNFRTVGDYSYIRGIFVFSKSSSIDFCTKNWGLVLKKNSDDSHFENK